jgi:Ca2+-transporting ATPase
LLDSGHLQVDESVLTGESIPSQKIFQKLGKEIPIADRENMAYMGTAVTSGSATGIVVATGHGTEMGAIAEHIATTTRLESPLQQRMKRFAWRISIIILVVATIAFSVGFLLGEPLLDMFLTSVSLAVSAMPEGLPVVMTVALAVGVQRMAKRNAVIRRLPSVETLGSCTIILSDKTGTLTENKMTVQQVWAASERFEINDEDSRFVKDDGSNKSSVEVTREGTPIYKTLLAGVMTNEASLGKESRSLVTKGDPTEVALLVSGSRVGLSKDRLLEKYQLVEHIPFDAAQRYSATIYLHNDKKLVFIKGALEKLLGMSDFILTSSGFKTLEHREIEDESEQMARQGLRVLAMAVGEGSEIVESVQKGKPSGLTLLGIQGMMDPPRKDTAKAVAACHRSGIRVMMLTGDNQTTALAVARMVGIVTDKNSEVRTGTELAKMSDSELEDTAMNVSVYARVSPSQKLRLVHALRKRDQIIAVTGDGVNDAPALKSAHIGVAMGRGGTDVAKEASEMVITDDNFATIYAAVEEGRTVFSNIRKATFFLISSGIGEVMLILASLGMRLPLPLLPAQILWLNVVTNGVEDVGLAFEPGEEDQFHQPPKKPKEGVLSRLLLERSIIVGIIMAIGTLSIFMWERNSGASLEYARVAALTTLVMFQIFHVFNSRSVYLSLFRKNPFSNKFLFIGTILSATAHLGAMYFEPTQTLLRLEPLTLGTWIRLIPIALSVLLVVEIHKLLKHNKNY